MSKINSFTIWSFTMYHLVERAVAPAVFIDRFAIPDKPGEHKKAVVRFIGLPLFEM